MQNEHLQPTLISIGLCLTAIAGWVDAIGFLQLGGLYTSFMSGNTTQLGVGLGRGSQPALVLPLLLLAFISGSFLGSLSSLVAGRWCLPAVLGLVSCLLAGAFWLFERDGAIQGFPLLLAGAMGAQNSALYQVRGVRTGTTYVTGTLVNAGQDLAKAVVGVGPRWRWLLHLLVWSALMAGAAGGTAVFDLAGRLSLAIPMIATIVLTVMATGHAWFAVGNSTNDFTDTSGRKSL